MHNLTCRYAQINMSFDINDYIRFHEGNSSDKNRGELRDEAIQNSYNIAPDYIRLTQETCSEIRMCRLCDIATKLKRFFS